jgi:hypothetical protein
MLAVSASIRVDPRLPSGAAADHVDDANSICVFCEICRRSEPKAERRG